MNDLFSKTMLGVIALCLLALVAQGYGVGVSRVPEAAGPAGVEERYKLVPVAMTRSLFRIDLETGETWHSPLMGAMHWRPVTESAPAAEAEPAVQPEPTAEPAVVEE